MIVCQTNFMLDVRSCTVPGEHEATCDGWEYRYSVEKGREVDTGRECRSCAPRRAYRGFVCQPCYEMIVAGDAAYAGWSRPLRGVDRAIAPDASGGGRALGYVPHSTLDLDRDALHRALRSYAGGVDQWVSTTEGAADAIRFGLEMRAATRKHPVKEEEHTLQRTYCTQCRQLTLVWHPPTRPGGPVVVKCRNPKCGHVVNERAHDDIAYIEESVYRKKGRR